MPSAEITRPKKNLHRSNSLHSELSSNSTQSKKVVSFNRDVAIKRIPRGDRNASVKLVAVVRPNAAESSKNHHLWINDELSTSSIPSDQLLKEAQSIIDNVNRIECSSNSTADKPKPPNKFSSLFTRTLPNSSRLGRSNSEIPLTRSNRRVSNVNGGSILRVADSAPRDFNEVDFRRGQISDADEFSDIGNEQWRSRIRKPPQPRTILSSHRETSSGSDTRSTPPKEFPPTSHPNSDLPIANRHDSALITQRNSPSNPYQYSRTTDSIQKPFPYYDTDTANNPPEIIYAHIVADDADGSKRTLHTKFHYTPLGHGVSTRESSLNYSVYDKPAEYGSVYRSSTPRNNVTTVLLNSIDEDDSFMSQASPRPFFYGDSIDGKHFNSSSLDSSSPDPSPTPTGFKVETERRNYTREPSRLDYRTPEEEYKKPPKDFMNEHTRQSIEAEFGCGNNEIFPRYTSTLSSNGLNQSNRSYSKEKNLQKAYVVPESKPSSGGGLISTLMRRGKAKEKKHENEVELNIAPNDIPKPAKKPNKFLSLFMLDKTGGRKSKNIKNGMNEKKTKDIIRNDLVLVQAEKPRDLGDFYPRQTTDEVYRNERNRISSDGWCRQSELESAETHVTKQKPYNFKQFGNDNACSEPQTSAWEPVDYRLNMATANMPSTLGRPSKVVADYTTRSKSLDRRNLRKVDDHRVNGRFNSPEIPAMARVIHDELGSPSDTSVRNHGGFDPNLRYFGDTDIENYTTMRPRQDTTEHRNASQNMSTAKDFLQRGKSGTTLLASESAGSENGGSSGSSQRSIYLHAPAVADIPASIMRRALSKDEIFNSSTSQIGVGGVKQSRRLGRSVSVLAPWRPRIYRAEQ